MKSQHTFSVMFLARKGKSHANYSLIYARISVNGSRVEFSVKQKTLTDQWDKTRGYVKGHSQDAKRLNQYLSQIRAEIFDAYDELRRNDEFLSANAIKARFLKEDQNTHTLLSAIQYHYRLANSTIRPGTLKNYKTTERYVKIFLKEQLKCEDITLHRLRYSFITKFENYLRMHTPTDHQRPMGNNTVMKHLQRLRKMVSMTVRLEWIEKDPFDAFKAHYVRKEREFLTRSELSAIEEKVIEIDRLKYVRDLFVFSCYTGLAYIDTISLATSNLVIGIDGERWIHTSRRKTDNPVKVPLLPKAVVLIEKYKNNPKAIHNGTLFPKISNQKLNSYLKEIADICGITKNVTFHLARHTFATTVTLSNGVPLATVSKLLGHSKITSTQIYAKVIESKVSDDMKRLKEQLVIIKNKESKDHLKATQYL